MALRAYLPAVFEYRRVGGSQEAGEPPVGEGQLPGRELKFRQYLVVASSPSVELRYSVDISKSYFRRTGRPSGSPRQPASLAREVSSTSVSPPTSAGSTLRNSRTSRPAAGR